MPKTIMWLASYPKSGNTWLRLFLFNYLFNPDQPAPINQAHRIGPGDSVAALYRKISKHPVDLTDQIEVLRLRPGVIAAHASNGADVNFMKTHNANIDMGGLALIPLDLTRGALYVLRNPIDMVVSYAHHYGLTHDATIHSISSKEAGTLSDESTVYQYLGNWSQHVRSWTQARGFKTCAIRYEDMTASPHDAFAKVLKFIGAPVDEARLDKAIRFSSFKEAKKQEVEHGFIERPQNSDSFFRSGKVGEGRATLSQSAIERIIADHGSVMKKYGYLE